MASETRPEVKFDIKLLSAKTVVMVECPGYETELFMPQIVKGRITFQNIIPNRRCCPESILLSEQFVLRGEVGAGTRQVAGTPLRSSQAVNLSPLARSTPSSVTSLKSRASRERNLHVTPEPARCRPISRSSLGGAEIDLGEVYMPPDLDVTTASLPSPGARLSSTYHSPSLPESKLSPPAAPSCNLVVALPKESISNITQKEPVLRTYSRKKVGSSGISKATVWSPLNKKKKEKISLTKAPSPTVKVEVRKRKLIVDAKKSIAAHDPNKIAPVPITKKKIIRKQVTGKTRKQFEALKATAYDLLTNPSLTHMSSDLCKQFQLACMDKCATTLPNYAEVAVTPPLELDRQVKSLMAKQKRMDRKERIPKGMTSIMGKRI